MNFRLILIGLLLFAANLLSAQTDFRKGLVVMPKGDTVKGEIEHQDRRRRGTICRFRIDENHPIQEFAPGDIAAYRYLKSKYFVSMDVGKKKLFLEMLAHGEIDFYYARYNKRDHYFLKKGNQDLIELPFEDEIRYTEKSGLKSDYYQFHYYSSKHKGILLYYTQDAPRLKAEIEQIKTPSRNNLIQLAKDYHAAISMDTANIVSVNKENPRICLEFGLGISSFAIQKEVENSMRSSMPAAFLVNFCLGKNKKVLYFKTGMIFSSLAIGNSDMGKWTFPLQLQFVWPQGDLRPAFGYGINCYANAQSTVDFNAGFIFKATPKLGIHLFYDLECLPKKGWAVVFGTLYSQSVNVGVQVNLK